jgi:hypothetical protein
MRRDEQEGMGVVVWLAVLACLLSAGLTAFFRPGDRGIATRVLAMHGWTNVTVMGDGIATGEEGCSTSDDAYYEARGTSPDGSVQGALVCCGLAKVCTVEVRP